MVDFVKRDKNDIFNKPLLGFLFKNSKFLLTLRITVVALFFYAVYFGFVHLSRENIFTGAVFWGVFWALFMVVTLPTFGRIFCGICPHGFLGKYITKAGLKKTMPKWMQNRYIGITLLVLGWWGVYYTFPGFWKSPFNTAAMFGGLTLLSFIIYYLYKDMGYCKFICPIGTLTRAYDKLSFTKLETYTDSCKDCKTFECATACQYNLKPFTFSKKNQTDDCTLCMDCAASCEAVKFKFTKPAEQLSSKLKLLNAEIWAYILILASIPVSMGFAHGLERTKIADQFIWNSTAKTLGMEQYAGGFTFAFAVIFTVFFSVIGLYLASKVLKKEYNNIFTNLGVALIPLFIFASLGHTLEMFFIKDYAKIIEGFAQGFSISVDIENLAQRGDKWLHFFGLFKWIGITWAFIILYKRMKLIESTKLRKVLGYFFASFAILFYIGLNIYTGYVFKTYGAKARGGHSHGSMKNGAMFQSVPFKDATLLQKGNNKESCPTCGMKLPMFYKTNHAATHKHENMQFCSLHCLADELYNNKKELTDIKVVDTNSLKFIDAKKAFYVIGSKKQATMSKVSKYAFSSKGAAIGFSKRYGGEVMNFKDAYKEALKDFKKGNKSSSHSQKAKALKPDELLYFSMTNPRISKKGSSGMGHMHGGGGGKPKWGAIPTKTAYIVHGQDIQNKQCTSKLTLDITAYDTLKKELKTKLSSKMGCDSLKFETPKNGYYTLLATNKTIQNNILYYRVAKIEYLHGKHGSDDIYESKLSQAVENKDHKIDLIRLRDTKENSFFYKHSTGDILKFKALLDSKPLADAQVTMYTDTGWEKTVTTDKSGIASFTIIKDYFPKWNEFNNRHKGKFLVTLRYVKDNTEGTPYNKINYSVTYPASFYPSKSEYQSYGYGLILLTLTLLVSGIIVYRFRKNRTKPFSELKHGK